MKISPHHLKKRFSWILLFLFTLVYSENLNAQTVTVNNINFSVNTSSKTATCTGLSSSSVTVTDWVMPDNVTYNSVSYPVTGISNRAFSGRSNLKGKITFGANLTTIGENAFENCYGITEVNFSKCSQLTELGTSIFRNCTSLETVVFGTNSAITKIGALSYRPLQSGPFADCKAIKSVDLYNCKKLDLLGWAAFQYCENLAGPVELPNSVTYIAAQAFEGCKKFEGELSFSDNVTIIGSRSYEGCSELKTLILGPNLKELGTPPNGIDINRAYNGDAFTLCTSLQTIISNAVTPPKTFGDANFPSSVYETVPLYVPKESVELYKSATEWKKFKIINPLDIEAEQVILNVQDLNLLVGQTDKLKATVLPENATDQTITWKSDNMDVATVSADGTVTAVSVGVANITASCGEVSATCKVTVNPVPASSIELSSQNVTLLIGSETTLTAKVYPENATYKDITWTSNNTSVASVDGDGIVTAIKEGEATITAACGSVSATCKVTVTPVAPTSIELNVKDMILYIGQSETIQAIVRPANTTYPTVIWQSEDESVATVSANGTVYGVMEGTTIITATCGTVSATCKVTVNPIPASNIEITSGNVTLTIGSSTVLTAKVSPDNTTHPEVDWSSSDNSIATVAADGTVTALNIGTAIITAKCGNVSATCTVTVIPVPSEGIVISPSEVAMLLGDTFTLSATVFPENTTDKNLTWGSDNPAVASVSSGGVVTALSLGTARITARNGNSSATCQVTVNPVVATGISLNVKDETIFVASSTQLVATISPSNVTDKTITWTSSKPEIATVTERGEVLGISVGTTTVTATIGSVSASCQINVVHRIPDMDPAVTTSERDIITISGNPVKMAVYAEGGESTGWSYLWTRNGETVSKSSELNLTAINDSETVIAETYRVKVENEIDKVVILSEIFDFVVQIYPAVGEVPDGSIDISISTGTDSSNKTREGNIITLSAKTPSGGYPQGWEFIWSDDARREIGEGESIETVATMPAGTAKAIETTYYTLVMTNYGPEDDVWAQFKLNSNPIAVYRRPQTPVQMLRKGNGTSHTFVTMMALSDSELEQLDYKFIYGWTDADGNDHVIDNTNERYCHTDSEIYNDPTNKFWVYSIWVYEDGCMVSSGLRYLDGNVDEDFDASVFDGSFVNMKRESKTCTAIYTIDGQYMGSDVKKLAPGIYIRTSTDHGKGKTEKIIIR